MKTPNPPIVVGTRLLAITNSMLKGIVYEIIHKERVMKPLGAPDSSEPAVEPHYSIVFEDGTERIDLPDFYLQWRSHWQILPTVASQDEIDELRSLLSREAARLQEEADRKQAELDAEVLRLRTSHEYSHMLPRAEVLANLRRELKHRFPEAEFRVWRRSPEHSVVVKALTGGVDRKAWINVVSLFVECAQPTPWQVAFGSCRTVSLRDSDPSSEE